MRKRKPINRHKRREQGLQKVSFKIEHVDALGQGVCKLDNKVTFIAKTLPGEQGKARIHKRSKGVRFATVETIDIIDESRIEPSCEHFSDCPACHYLHTDYRHELNFKTAALEKSFRSLMAQVKFDSDNIQVFAAPERLNYRNRVQLHYRHQYIGMLNASNDQVVEIPQCKILREELKPAFDALYTDSSWQGEKGERGHCELYLDSAGTVRQNWNAEYAEGGFTQVNEAMNQLLLQQIVALFLKYTKIKQGLSLLDLFSGSGNLSNALMALPNKPVSSQERDANTTAMKVQRVMIDRVSCEDVQQAESQSEFFSIDLFDDTAFSQFKNKLKKRAVKPLAGGESQPLITSNFDVMLVDPPRKGFPQLNAWVNGCKPKTLIYVSCNVATMVRDLQSLDKKFTINELQLLDLFPSTYHFETVVFLSF